MIRAVVISVVFGVVAGAWATLLWGAVKGTSFKADVLAATLSFGLLAYVWSPAPTPVSVVRSAGWVTTTGGLVAVALGSLAVGATLFMVLSRRGPSTPLPGDSPPRSRPTQETEPARRPTALGPSGRRSVRGLGGGLGVRVWV